MSNLLQKIAELSPEKRELLLQKLNQQKGKVAPVKIQPQSRDKNTFPLSFAQQRLWFFSQLEPESSAYNIPSAIRLTGRLNITALENSINEIVRRHEILRTNFTVIDGEPVQIISIADKLKLPIIDLENIPETEREAEALHLATLEAQKPFNLEQDLLLRVSLLRLGELDHIILFTMHHIVSDGWSTGVLIRELTTLYKAYDSNQPCNLPELSIQYVDFAVWQRQYLQGEVLQTQLNYWKQKLGGDLPVLELPTDRPRPAIQTDRGATQSFTLSPSLTAALKNLSQQEGVTLFMTLLAAFKVLLHRYTQQDDILVGTPIANRNRSEIEGLIGFFVNTLVLRSNFKDNPSFQGFLAQIKKITLEAYAHQDLPFEQLVEELQPERNLSHSSLFQVMFILQNTSTEVIQLPDLTLQPFKAKNNTAKFDLTLSLSETEAGLQGNVEYNTDLFDADRITRMLGHFQILLEGIVHHPEKLLSELPLLTANEQHQLLIEWNHADINYPQNQCLHQLFEAQVEKTPDAIAVVFEHQQLTYQALNQKANQLAHYLQKLGVGPEVLVGICVERSLEMIVGILAILKAGGAYIPLDPAYPKERLGYILADTQVTVLLTQKHLLEILPAHSAQTLYLNQDENLFITQSTANPISNTTSENLAYVIYTSGSTGQPKGVLINHSNVVRLFAAVQPWYNFHQQDVWTLFHSYAFDFSVWEIWGALLYGGQLVVVPYWVSRSPEAFYQLLSKEQVTVLNQTPSAFRQLINVEESASEILNLNLRLVIFGGEALDIQSLQPWFARHGDQSPQLVNMYGITETTVHVTYRPLTVADLHTSASVIGRPIPDLQVYLLDKNQQLVPLGVPGEMYIGGAGLARGYLNRPDITQQRFIVHPLSNQGKIYKSGDLARYLPNGDIEYLGRIDHQVKIRGFRIEIGEIEAALSQHPDIREAVVIVREDRQDDKRLVAYLVFQATHISILEIRNFLKAKLPDYMIPSAFVVLEKIPLTPNGKIDRRALPQPQIQESENTFTAANNYIEEILVNLWSKIIGVSPIGINDDFFGLGGHSLLATQVISRIRQIFKVELPLRCLFETPTIAGIAANIQATLQQNRNIQIPPILPCSRHQELPLSYAQQRLWFFSQLEPESSAYNIPAAIRLTGKLNITALENSINEIVRRHEILRTNFTVIDGEPVQIISIADKLKLPIIDLENLPQTEREAEALRLAMQEAQTPFNLEKDSLLRVILLRLGETEHVILFTMHHIISDGWSTGVLIRELTTLYKAYNSNQPCNLPELPIQYADFAVWQRQYLQGEILQTQLNYWQQQLSGDLPVLELPTDRPRPAIQTDRGATLSFTISPSVTAALKNLSQQEGVTLFMTLLAAFKVLLYRYTQQNDILIGTPIANRNHPGIEELIGFFVNTLVLRSNLRGNPTFRELLAQVREVTLGAYTHQDLPFEQLVEELQPERDLSHSSLFQVMFILQNTPTETLHLPDLILNPLKVESKTANFDLTLSMVDTETGLRGSLEYNTDLFDADRITRMCGHFQTLLAGIVATPEQNISNLPLLTTSEKQQIFLAGNADKISIPNQCIHQLFEAQVERNPDAVAVVFGEKQLTYQELNQRANQLANYLQVQGVKPEVLVGVCLERSLEMVVGVLGILKAGGAYLPIDPAYPQERLAYMLADAQVSVILTQTELLAGFSVEDQKIICINSDWEEIATKNKDNPVSKLTPNNLAYVIYTSGSTGKSKGVMIEHRSLVNAYLAWEDAYKLPAITSHLQMASFSFDVFSGDLVRALCSGGKLVLCPRDLLLEPEKLYQLILQEKVDCAEFVPGVFRNLCQYLEQTQQRLDFMQLLVCGSDSWYVQEYEKFRQFCSPQTRLINSFGLTEATIDSTYFETKITNFTGDQLVPIGRPFANTQIYILDQYLQPLPIGIPGEICISGAGLARGYLHKPDLTASKFIPNTLSEKTGDLIYKTGDLGRWLADGNIELIGRLDNQVKLRGFRIELGEIEAVLSKHPMVRESVVLVREDKPKQQQLVAYIVLEQKQINHINSSELQEYLQEQLPNYMIPSAFVILEFFPLTPNGKIDRRALPKPELKELQQAFVAPQTDTEITLAQIWSEVLNLQKVSIHDNFFELGGNSLLTTKLILKIRSTFQIDLPLRIVFESPTIASLGVNVEKLLKAEPTDELSLESVIKWDKETTLDSTIYPVNTWKYPQNLPNSILLTGATGFLGAFLLWEILQQTQADVYCLIRAISLAAAKEKIQTSLKSYQIWDERFNQRIIPVIGDLSQPLLGLNQRDFQDLAHHVDVIYHNGAWVNHIYPYSVLKAANVLGTQEVLRLACAEKTKPVHFISTTSIFSNSGASGGQIVTEVDDIDTCPVNSNGYVQTKWVSEKLLLAGKERGIPISVYRIGRVSGHSQTGVFNVNDLIYKLIIGCIQLGSVPNRDLQEDIMPVDYTSKAIVHLSRQDKSLDKAFHLLNSQLLHTDTLLKVIRSYGYQVQQVSYQDWQSQLINVVGKLPEHPLYPLVPLFSAKPNQNQSLQSGTLQFDCQNVVSGLAGSSITCPDIDENLLSTYISYLAKNGFLEKS